MKQAAQIYGAINMGDMRALVNDIKAIPEVAEFLDERGLKIAEIPLADFGLGNGSGKLYLPVPKDLDTRIEDVVADFLEKLGG